MKEKMYCALIIVLIIRERKSALTDTEAKIKGTTILPSTCSNNKDEDRTYVKGITVKPSTS